MLHVRVIAPREVSARALRFLDGEDAVALSYGVRAEAFGSALQLLINLTAIVLAGVLTLLTQQAAWFLTSRRRARR